MRTVARSRPLQCHGNAGVPRSVNVGQGIQRPAWSVKVTHELVATVVAEQRVYAGVDGANQMSLHDLRCEGLILAPRLSSVRPASDDRRAPAGLPRSLVLPSQRVDILAPGEELPKQRDLLLAGRTAVQGRERRKTCGVLKQRRFPRSHGAGSARVIQAQKATKALVFGAQSLELVR